MIVVSDRAAGVADDYEARRLAAWKNVPTGAGPRVAADVKIDCDGRRIRWSEYGQYSACGWQIDHAWAPMLGGPDVPWNLRARHWRGNSAAGGTLEALFGIR